MHQGSSPRIAVVIPVYRGDYLAQCVASALAQTRPPDQVIVVDDGSPDVEAIDRALLPHGDRVTLIRQANAGAGAARNRGILAADTEFIAFLDGDDIWAPDFLARQLQLLSRDPRVDLVYSNARIIGEGPLRGSLFMETAPSCGEVTLESLLSQRCTVLTSSVLVRKQVLLEVGLFDEALRRGQDFDMWVRLAAAGVRFAYTTAPLVERRLHDHNLSGNRIHELERARSVLVKLRTKLTLSAAQADILDSQVRLLQSQLHVEQGKRDLEAGALAAATTHFREAAQTGAGWKTRVVRWALQIAPGITRQAYLRKLRRGSTGTLRHVA